MKLQNIGISGLLYENIKRLQESVAYMVKVKGGYLEPIKIHMGLRQGGILSPILFNPFIDDIKDIFDKICEPINLSATDLFHLLYADGLILLSKSEKGLKHCLKNLEEYCRTWQLEINVTKSKVMIFNSSGRKLKYSNFCLQDHTLNITDSYCYLGVDMTPSGSLQHTQKPPRKGTKQCKIKTIRNSLQKKTEGKFYP